LYFSVLKYTILLQIKDCLPSDGITFSNLTLTEVVFKISLGTGATQWSCHIVQVSLHYIWDDAL